MQPKLKPPVTKRLKLKWDILHSNYAFNFNLRRYILGKFVGILAGLEPEPAGEEEWRRLREGMDRTRRMRDVLLVGPGKTLLAGHQRGAAAGAGLSPELLTSIFGVQESVRIRPNPTLYRIRPNPPCSAAAVLALNSSRSWRLIHMPSYDVASNIWQALGGGRAGRRAGRCGGRLR
jgi:hypothetical protein